MAAIPGIPQSPVIQSANQQILLSWNLSVGATSYVVQRSEDNVTYATLATVSGSPLAISYLDTSAVLGVQYFYQVAAANADGTSPYCLPLSEVAAPAGEMCLGQIRLKSQQTADLVGSNHITKAEWNSFINLALAELYEILVNRFEDQFLATPVQFNADGTTFLYDLPNGSNTFLNGINTAVTFTPRPFFKLTGVDLQVNNAANAYVTLSRFNFIERNNYVWQNAGSTAFAPNNLKYRPMGDKIEFMPTPSSNQSIRLWYIPRLEELLRDTDTTTAGINGWNRYVIVRAAIYALTKEESPTESQERELVFLKDRIELSASNRDVGQPDTISDTRGSGGSGYGWGSGGNGNGWGW